MPSTSERLLVQQIRLGDPRAWEHLIDQYEGRLRAFVQRRLRDLASSEDVVQETFQGFLLSLPNFDERRELQTWLFTIASHKLTDFLRKQGRHPIQHISDGPDDLLHQKHDDQPAASSLARSQERRELESDALAAGLSRILDGWREQEDYQRIQVLELIFVKGWPNKDVASFLKISEQQVANIRFAAMKKLGELIRDAGLPTEVFPELRDT